jgi:hypothetical protein
MKESHDYGLNISQILSLLEEPRSIASLSRELGSKTHRLVLTGYILALKDLGYLEDRLFPPSRVFRVRKDRLGEIEERLKSAGDTAPLLEGEIEEAISELYPEISKIVANHIEKNRKEWIGRKVESTESMAEEEEKE